MWQEWPVLYDLTSTQIIKIFKSSTTINVNEAISGIEMFKIVKVKDENGLFL